MHPRTWLTPSRCFVRTLRSTASAPSISPHWHGFLVFLHIVEVGEGALQFPAVDGLGGFAGVFEGAAEVGAPGPRGFAWLEVGGCVADLVVEEVVSRCAGAKDGGEQLGG